MTAQRFLDFPFIGLSCIRGMECLLKFRVVMSVHCVVYVGNFCETLSYGIHN